MKENLNPLPTSFNPLDHTHIGDWAVYTCIQKPIRLVKRTGLLFTVEEVTKQNITISHKLFSGIPHMPDSEERIQHSRTEPLKLETFLKMAPLKFREVKCHKEVLPLSGRELSCEVVSFLLDLVDIGWKVWLSKEVGALGIARIQSETTTIELLGFGNGDITHWGKNSKEHELSRPENLVQKEMSDAIRLLFQNPPRPADDCTNHLD